MAFMDIFTHPAKIQKAKQSFAELTPKRLETETPYNIRDRVNGAIKHYYEDGTLDYTELYVGGSYRMNGDKHYDKNGNEIK